MRLKIRNEHDYILLSILPHLLTVYFTYDDITYTVIVLLVCLTSYIWHKNHEPHNYLLIADYICAGLLSLYETIDTYKYNRKWVSTSICLNFSVLIVNKTVYLLSKYKVIRYNKWHSAYHIFSSLKTIFISYLTWKIRF